MDQERYQVLYRLLTRIEAIALYGLGIVIVLLIILIMR